MKQIGTFIIIFSLLVLIQCESNQTNPNIGDFRAQSNDSIHKDTTVSTNFLGRDSIQNINQNQFRILKTIVVEESKNKNSTDSIIVTLPDSLSEFVYINELFSIDQIDSMEIYGRLYKNLNLKRYAQLNTLIILYFNSSEHAISALESLEVNQFENEHSEDIFKAGGICFTLQNQLCLYPIDGCGPGFKNIERIDSIISKKIFNDRNYDRLLDRCGMFKFIHQKN